MARSQHFLGDPL